jgi:hypothetical protein
LKSHAPLTLPETRSTAGQSIHPRMNQHVAESARQFRRRVFGGRFRCGFSATSACETLNGPRHSAGTPSSEAAVGGRMTPSPERCKMRGFALCYPCVGRSCRRPAGGRPVRAGPEGRSLADVAG